MVRSAGIADLVSLGLQGTQVMRGWQETLQPAAPAAGNPFTRTVPGETWERVLCATAKLTTSAVVATRFLHLRIQAPDGTDLAVTPLSAGVAASLTVQGWAFPGATFNASNQTGVCYAPLPDLLLKAGYKVVADVTAMDAGDTITSVAIVVQRFPTEHVTEVEGKLHDIAEHTGQAARWSERLYTRMAAWLDGG